MISVLSVVQLRMYGAKAKRKRIEVNAASLVGLKAEIARRKAEVNSKVTILPDGCKVIKSANAGVPKPHPKPKSPEQPSSSGMSIFKHFFFMDYPSITNG